MAGRRHTVMATPRPEKKNRRTVEHMIAQVNARYSKLRIEQLPERAGVDRMLRAGVAVADVTRWLQDDCGYGARIKVNKVERYKLAKAHA
jgi:UDP-N-acetylglucosamine 2-epimerase